MNIIDNNRNFMKSNFKEMENVVSDQMKNLPQPTLEKEFDKDSEIFGLVPIEKIKIENDNLILNIEHRKSHRQYIEKPLSLGELSFLLWASQGVKSVYERNNKSYATFRTVPSAGSRHPFETYLLINNVDGLKRGLYRYLAIEHKLMFIHELENQNEGIIDATLGQKFTGKAAVVFIWSCVAYRGEWRYNIAAHKAMLLDAGHVCQNLYLACEGINAGTCAIAAYDQEKVDTIIDVDGKNEFSVYLAPVGKY
ncbi:MAG: SagB/ThcOx family dehydrogenase [Candidatus Tenebribacter burtonii]|jgi:SagB-type dehydrogenase family enzyme|nr:SagB/ThcOx family dehydrogenase [Candidatus Tenebribacter burtonii]